MTRNERIRFLLMRDGIEYGELFADGSPTLQMDAEGEIKMSLQGNFLPTALDAGGNEVTVDWMQDEIKPVLIIDGTAQPLGVLMPEKITPRSSKGKTVLEIQALDRCWRARDNKVEGTVYLTAGTEYIYAIENLLASCGVATVIATPSTETLAENREDWKTGDSYLKIVNTLLSEINYKDLWFDSSGAAILEPVSIPTAESIQHVFTGDKPDPRNPKEVEATRVYPSISRETDIYEAPNVFVCVCSNADKDEGMKATAENTNPASPLSIARRGRRIVQVTNVDNIASESELQAYADRLLHESMTTGETIQVTTMLQQGFGVEDVTAIRYGDAHSGEYDSAFGICVETGWNMQLTPGGTMTHTLKKVVTNLE